MVRRHINPYFRIFHLFRKNVWREKMNLTLIYPFLHQMIISCYRSNVTSSSNSFIWRGHVTPANVTLEPVGFEICGKHGPKAITYEKSPLSKSHYTPQCIPRTIYMNYVICRPSDERNSHGLPKYRTVSFAVLIITYFHGRRYWWVRYFKITADVVLHVAQLLAQVTKRIDMRGITCDSSHFQIPANPHCI